MGDQYDSIFRVFSNATNVGQTVTLVVQKQQFDQIAKRLK